MAIRIREINGETVALCAAKTKAEEGDIYISDASHHALSTKLIVDFTSEGWIPEDADIADDIIKPLMLEAERNG